MTESRLAANRQLLAEARARGSLATLTAFVRLSGPGWLQSAITLGGGSLGGALYLGMLGGTSMLWLQLVAIAIGVIMLSAISHVTLSTGMRPYQAINEYVNPVLGVGWITATILANMIWILPQFGLCFDSLESCLGQINDSPKTKILASLGMGITAFIIVAMSFNPGWMSKSFDLILKLLVGTVVICFVAAVACLFQNGSVQWRAILRGFVPNPQHWGTTSPELQMVLSELPTTLQAYWKDKIVANQRSSMIGVTATAVGLNMTFLLPYSMLARGWDRHFRGSAVFDLIIGMAIPYIVVTSCIVIASAHAFHAKADVEFLDDNPAVVQTSKLFASSLATLRARYEIDLDAAASDRFEQLDPETQRQTLAQFATAMSQGERKLAATLIKPNAGQLAQSLKPLLGEQNANRVFGLGAFAMGFSSIIILMLINGYAFAEVAGHCLSSGLAPFSPSRLEWLESHENTIWRLVGAFSAGLVGFFWWRIWTGDSKTWLIIVASTFGAILLPIAYVSFFALMNNKRLLGADKPTGLKMIVWNLLMAIGVAGAILQAVAGAAIQMDKKETGSFVIGGLATFLLLALVGFSARFRRGTVDQE